MNIKRLKQSEAEFLLRYPGGFDDEELKQVTKKHRVGKLAEQAQDLLGKAAFAKQATALDAIVKMVTRSSMVSLFEKPKFRDYVNGLSRADRSELARGFELLLHPPRKNQQQKGFEQVLDVLAEGKLAKWSLMTICPFYLRPQDEVFVKPTTTKNAIAFFELEGLEYKPRPSWDFYARYRDTITEMKSHVDPSLSPNNAAFTGFLMVSMGSR